MPIHWNFKRKISKTPSKKVVPKYTQNLFDSYLSKNNIDTPRQHIITLAKTKSIDGIKDIIGIVDETCMRKVFKNIGLLYLYKELLAKRQSSKNQIKELNTDF